MFTTLLLLSVLPLLLIGSGFFSGTETALFSLTQQQRLQLQRSPSVTARTIVGLLEDTRPLLITLLMGNMTINVLFFVISSLIVIRLERVHEASGALITTAAIAPLLTIILLGEVLPKLTASRLTLGWAKFFALPLWTVHTVLTPLRGFTNFFVITPLARLVEPSTKPTELSTDELEDLLKLSQQHGVIDHGEEDMLQQVLELDEVRITELMTPRVDVHAHDLQDDPNDLVQLALNEPFSRFPVYEDKIDQIVGVVFARQVLLHRPESAQALRELIHETLFVPEQMRADRLLVEFRKRGAVFAVVVDEYGGTAGVITLEDVVEHMVGEIAADEETIEEPELQLLGPGHWRASAALSVRDWPDAFGQPIPLHGAQTLGGLVMALLGRVAVLGDEVRVGNLQITVSQMQGPRVVWVELKQSAAPAPKAVGGDA